MHGASIEKRIHDEAINEPFTKYRCMTYPLFMSGIFFARVINDISTGLRAQQTSV